MNAHQQRQNRRQYASPPANQTSATGQSSEQLTAHAGHDPEQILKLLREELDRLDRALLETLRQRLDCCCRIGLHKRDHAIPMMQPHRIGVVQARAAAFAAEHGMSPAFLRSLYELIIAETCRLEDEIIGVQAGSA